MLKRLLAFIIQSWGRSQWTQGTQSYHLRRVPQWQVTVKFLCLGSELTVTNTQWWLSISVCRCHMLPLNGITHKILQLTDVIKQSFDKSQHCHWQHTRSCHSLMLFYILLTSHYFVMGHVSMGRLCLTEFSNTVLSSFMLNYFHQT